MLRLGSTLLLSALASAQVFVVDASNGPGANFTSISAAVAAVPSGAVLQVRSGTYGPFLIQQKSLTVIGDPGVAVLAVFQQPIAVSGLLASQSVTLRGLSWSNFLGAGELLCQNCAGTILIDSCTANPTVSSTGGYVRAMACDQLLLRDTSLGPVGSSIPALQAAQSNVAVTNCTLEGFGYTLMQTNGRVQLTGCTVLGATFGQPIAVVFAGELVVNGATLFDSGPLGTGASLAIDGTGTVDLDPSTTFANVASPALAATLTVTSRSIPALDASTAGLGGQASASLAVPALGAGFLLVGFPTSPYSVPGIVDPAWLASAALHGVSGAPATTGGYPVPNATSVLGIQVGWQGVVLRSSGAFVASNPAVYSHW